jgi:hypothetical protein
VALHSQFSPILSNLIWFEKLRGSMANDKDWQRRSDQWVKSMHESRLRKEQRLSEECAKKVKQEEKTQTDKKKP